MLPITNSIIQVKGHNTSSDIRTGTSEIPQPVLLLAQNLQIAATDGFALIKRAANPIARYITTVI